MRIVVLYRMSSGSRVYNHYQKVILLFSNYLHLQIWILKICNHDISKTITAMKFKLSQMIENDKEINW